METIAAAGAGFLLAVLWFDLMFDVQVRGYRGTLPAEVLSSISAYYRRVTTNARPMGNLVSLAMLVTLAAIVAEIATGRAPRWMPWVSLIAGLSAMGLAGVRIVPNAKRLGAGADAALRQSALARSIYVEHVYCFVAICAVLGLQIALRF